MAHDPPLVPSIVVKNAIENQVPTNKRLFLHHQLRDQLDGVRVKLDYDKYHEEIGSTDLLIIKKLNWINALRIFNVWLYFSS